MGGETMDLQQLADYLRRDVREVSKLASRGNLPGRKVAGEWRFARAEINLWIERHLPAYTEQQRVAGKPLDAADLAKLRQQTRVELAQVLTPLQLRKWKAISDQTSTVV